MAGPITLNRAQFARTKAGAAGGTYAKYLHYLSVHRQAPGSLGEAKDVPPFTRPVSPRNAQVPTNTQNPHPAAPATMTKPLAPHPTAKAPTQPQPTLAELALKAATQAVQPQVDLLNQQAERGQAAISGYTQQFAADLGKIGQQTQGFYSDAAKSMAGLNGAVANAISTGGQEQATALLNEIAAHGVATGDAGDLVGQAQGAGNANLTSGASVLGALLASGAAADSRAAAMPGIAALSGLQQTRILQGNTQDKVAQALAQIPGLSQTVQGNLETEKNRQVDQAYKQQSLAETKRYHNAELANSSAKSQGLKMFGNSTTGEYAINPQTGKVVQLTAGTGPAPKVFGSAKSGYYSIDPSTSKVTQLTQPVKGTAAATGKSTSLQAKTVNGHTVLFNPKTGQFTDPGTQTVIDPNTLTAAAKPYSPATLTKISSGVRMAKSGYYGVAGTGGKRTLPNPVSPAALAKAATAAGMSLQEFKQDPKAMAAAGIAPVHVADSPNQDPLVNKVYLEILDQFGGNRQQAFNAVAQQFPGWGRRNRATFFPKGDAPQAGATGASYQVTTPTGAMKYASAQLPNYGWGEQEMGALQQLWNGESGWRFTATNPTSGAAGIPQALGHKLPANYATDPTVQINWGLKYIKQRYGTPSRALAFWQANNPHWY